jgi:arylsulfatase A
VLRRILGLVSCLWLAGSSLGAETRSPPNVVLILVDDMGWTGAGCYGSDLHQTPNIDRLASESVRFTQAYAAAPVCTPTRASILTGKAPARLHMTVWHESAGEPPEWMRRELIPPVTEKNLPLEETTLAELLRTAGYFNAHVGKWHLGDAGHYPQNHGFDVNIGGTFWGCPATFFYPYRGLFGSAKELRYVPDLPLGTEGEYLTDRLTDEALAILDRVHDRPFFLNLCYYTVHTPIEGKPEVVERYSKELRLGLDHDNAHYAAMHETLDNNVGRVLAKLEALGVADSTLVIFTSDNGGFDGQNRGRRVTRNTPLRSGKGSLYEGGIRIPLIVRWPGVTPVGGVCDEPVVTTDFYETIREVIGAPLPVGREDLADGLSIIPLLKDPSARLQREALFFHYPHYYQTTSPVSSVRAGEWKLLQYHDGGRLELFDLQADPGESKNLARQRPAKAQELLTRLEVWRAAVNAQMPRPSSDVGARLVAADIAALIAKAGNAEDDAERLQLLREAWALPGITSRMREELGRLCTAIEQWLDTSKLPYFWREVRDTMDFDFGIRSGSPLYPIACIYRGRMLVWTTLELGNIISYPERRRRFLSRAVEAFRIAQEAFPENRIVRMYLGEPVPWRKDLPQLEGAPAWALLQRENLECLTDIIEWWVEHRLQPDGQYGGGWGDDCEMWRWWVPVLLGFDAPKVSAAQSLFSAALMSQPHMRNGFTTRMSDVEHTAEDSADAITPMMHVDPDTPRWREQALGLARFMKEKWTGTNERGFLQFRSTYFTSESVDEDPRRACDTVYHPRAVQPALLLWQRTGNEELGRLFTAWMDTWVDATQREENGKPAGVIPSAIHWPDGRVGGLDGAWWDPRNHNEPTLYRWPSAMSMMCDTLLLTYHMTGNEKYLEPLFSMAEIRVRYLENPPSAAPEPGTAAWCAAKLRFLRATTAKYRRLTGDSQFDTLLALEGRLEEAVGRDRSVALGPLRESADALRINFAAYTSEVRWTDRVLRFPALFEDEMMFEKALPGYSAPNPALIYRLATGDPGSPGYFPMNAVRWRTPPRDIAARVVKADRRHFEAELFHFGSAPRALQADLYLLEAGRYTQSLRKRFASVDGDELQRQAVQLSGRVGRVQVELPPMTTVRLRLTPMD